MTKTDKKIEEILQKYGIATKMEVTASNSNDGVIEMYMEKVAQDLIEELTNLFNTELQEEKEKYLEGFIEWYSERVIEAGCFPPLMAEQYNSQNKEVTR